MESVLTAAAVLTCSHKPEVGPLVGGKVTIVARGPLMSNGNRVLTQADLVGASVTGCPAITNKGEATCATVVAVTGGMSSVLTSGGSPVLLSTLQATTSGSDAQGPAKVVVQQPPLVTVLQTG